MSLGIIDMFKVINIADNDSERRMSRSAVDAFLDRSFKLTKGSNISCSCQDVTPCKLISTSESLYLLLFLLDLFINIFKSDYKMQIIV